MLALLELDFNNKEGFLLTNIQKKLNKEGNIIYKILIFTILHLVANSIIVGMLFT